MSGNTIPLGSNYWNGGTGSPPIPTVNNPIGAAIISFDFNNPGLPLNSAPPDVGPNW